MAVERGDDEAWREILRVLGRFALGALALAVLIFLSVAPLRFGPLGAARPAFMLMAVYYWSMLRPAPAWAAFALGLLLDLLGDYPFGMNALVLVLAQMVTARNRKFLLGQPFLVIWAGFAVVALGATALQWALFSLFNLSLAATGPALLSVLLSSLLFPLAALPLAGVHRALQDTPHEP